MTHRSQLQALRQQHPIFHYHSFLYRQEGNEITGEFHFSIDGLTRFNPKFTLQFPHEIKPLLPETYCHYVFHLGLIESISYWKSTASPEVRIHCGVLSEKQIHFWADLFFKGLGEFREINQIPFTKEEFVKIVCDEDDLHELSQYEELDTSEQVIVPLGGGKDSIVTWELLQKYQPIPLLLNENKACDEFLASKGLSIKNAIMIHRVIDPALLKLNQQGYLNGHTPFSAVLAFYSVFAAAQQRVCYIALSNEWSANEGNVNYQGDMVNHQYSKTLEFEKKFRQYFQQFFDQKIEYFSLLRPLYETQIAQYFAKLKESHAVFKSCNQGKKENQWCGKCAKCLFVWIILSPYLDVKALENIFGKNLWLDADLSPIAMQLMGVEAQKPYECVGTYDEVHYALSKIKNSAEIKSFPLYQKCLSHLKPSNWQAKMVSEHCIPQSLLEVVKNAFA